MSPADAAPPSPGAYWVEPGRFAGGEHPVSDWSDPAAGVEALLRAGFDCFIDLTEEREFFRPYAPILEEAARALGVDVAYKRHPVRDNAVPQAPQHMAAILDDVDAALAEGRTVYLHCLGGVGRTGTAVGCWLVRHGRTGEEALAHIDLLRRGSPKTLLYPLSPGAPQQRRYVREWGELAEG